MLQKESNSLTVTIETLLNRFSSRHHTNGIIGGRERTASKIINYTRIFNIINAHGQKISMGRTRYFKSQGLTSLLWFVSEFWEFHWPIRNPFDKDNGNYIHNIWVMLQYQFRYYLWLKTHLEATVQQRPIAHCLKYASYPANDSLKLSITLMLLYIYQGWFSVF